MCIRDRQEEAFEDIYRLNKAIHLPTSLEEIEITREQWEECMTRIPHMSDVAHYPDVYKRQLFICLPVWQSLVQVPETLC